MFGCNKGCLHLVALCVAAAALHAAEKRTGTWPSDAGIDWRFYDVYCDDAPGYQNNSTAATATDPQRGKYYNYYRLRTRLWGRVGIEDQFELYGRIANEFRYYDNNRDVYPFPNELFIDNLYVDFRDLWRDRVGLRVGRQDMYYGGGRIIRDGTPGDVTRSFFFDAVKADIRLTEQSTLDLVGIWTRPEDNWTLGNEHVDLTRYQASDNGNALTERGMMAYYTNRESKDFPYELYYVYKDESRWLSSQGTRLPERRYHTLGMRLTPRFGERWSAETEVAGQYGEIGASGAAGERDILAMLAYGGVTYRMPEYRWQPYVTTACLFLSGDGERFDDPDARGRDTGWNPVFGRMIWYSDLLTLAYPFYRITNLVYPHLESGIKFSEGHALTLQAGPHFACARDNSNDDSFRGYLAFARYMFPLLRQEKQRRGAIRGVLKAEVLSAGDYYGNPDTAYYLRFEIHAQL